MISTRDKTKLILQKYFYSIILVSKMQITETYTVFFQGFFLLVDVIHTSPSASWCFLLYVWSLLTLYLNLLPSWMLTRRPSENQYRVYNKKGNGTFECFSTWKYTILTGNFHSIHICSNFLQALSKEKYFRKLKDWIKYSAG